LYGNSGRVTGAIDSIHDITLIKEGEKALQKTNDNLENGIQERTAELIAANKALENEIHERESAEAGLKKREIIYNHFFKTSMDCIFITLLAENL
jgi:two-component system NtrC family sensor kinase